MRRPTGVSAVSVLVMLAVIASVTGCGSGEAQSKDPKLAALEKERLATFRPPRGKLVLELSLAEDKSFKRTIAQINRVFSFADAKAATRGRGATITAAVMSGWRLNFAGTAPGEPLFGAKTLPTGGATLTIGEYEDDGTYKVTVRLEHQPCGKGRCKHG